MNELNEVTAIPESRLQKKGVFTVLTTLVLLIFFLVSVILLTIKVLNKPPLSFPTDSLVTVSEGSTVREITELLAEKHIVRSDELLYLFIVLFFEPTSIKASTYHFDVPLTTFDVAERLVSGDFDTDLIRLTHFEGERARTLASRAAKVLPQFNSQAFVEQAEEYEGYLFPDTYFVPETYTEDELLQLMRDTFAENIGKYEPDIEQSNFSLYEILILASIIEREANSPETMKLVASVFQNRLAIGMALQADASIEYVLDKPLNELTSADLEIDSPYNTYLYPGLPPTPIGNPGLDAIEAALYPAESEYFYYITGTDGEFYFAETYDEHLRNIERYLR